MGRLKSRIFNAKAVPLHIYSSIFIATVFVRVMDLVHIDDSQAYAIIEVTDLL